MRKDFLKMLDEARMCPDCPIFRQPLEKQADCIFDRMRTFKYSRTRILKILQAQAAEPPAKSIGPVMEIVFTGKAARLLRKAGF